MTADLKSLAAGGLIFMAAGLVMGPAPASAATPGVYYESFAGVQLSAISLPNPVLSVGVHLGNATNISAAGPSVYWQDGRDIYRSNFDLSGATLFHTNAVAPTDLAVDTRHGIYYESFAGVELAAISLSSPTSSIGVHLGNATNISAAGDYVYWQDGSDIYRANPDLSGAVLFHSNGGVPTDIAFDAAHDVYYESFAGAALGALSLSSPNSEIGFHIGNATNIALGDDGVYWQDGVNIYKSSFNLASTSLFHVNGGTPSDLAIQPAIPDVRAGVPEPDAWILLVAGFGLAGSSLRKRRTAKA